MSVLQVNHTVSADNHHTKAAEASGNAPAKKSNTFTIPVIGKRDGCAFSFLKDKPAVSANEYWSMLNRAEQSESTSADSRKEFLRALKIAKRIMNGDRVPMKDKRFLMNFSMEMYTMAVMLAKQNDHPKEYESVLEEEEGGENGDALEAGSETVSDSGAGEAVTAGADGGAGGTAAASTGGAE